jgi:AraC-like DNA-binding protein
VGKRYKTLEYKGKIVFNKLTITAPARELKPFQENEACFMFVHHGDFSIRTNEEVIPFKEKQGMLTKCFNFFIETTNKQRVKHSTIEFMGVFLFPSHVEKLLDLKLSESSVQVDYNMKRVEIDKLLHSFHESIDVLVENPELADEALIENKIREFVLLISKSQNMAPLDFLSAIFKLNAIDFKSTIHNNLYSNLSVREMAQLCAMSTSSFKRKFKEEFSESPKKYLANKKLERAVNLLKNSQERISDIAYECGYETISTFNRSFKSSYGISPSEFRLNQIAQQ